jgi:hypothetical protein
LIESISSRKTQSQALHVLLIVLGFVALGAWCASEGSPPVIWSLRVAMPLAAVGVIWLLVRVARRPDRLPDHLARTTGKYFEREGLCFAPRFEAAYGGACFLCLYVQNRFARPASARIDALPPVRSFRLSRVPLAPVSVRVECPGGAFGVVRVPFGVPAKYQGKRLAFEVAADVKYPAGRGEMLRQRGGVRAGSIREARPSHQLLKSLSFLFLGVIHTSRPASATMTLPRGVAESAPAGGPGAFEVLWLPELPTGGFPVLPRQAA